MDNVQENSRLSRDKLSNLSKSKKEIGLSDIIFQIKWNDFLPKIFLKDDLVFSLELSNHHEINDFVSENKKAFFSFSDPHTNFIFFESGQEKERYCKFVVDFFTIKVNKKIIGILSGNVLDWSTYYIRHNNILPEYRGRQVSVEIINYLLKILEQSNVKRVESHIAVNNLSQLNKLKGYGFIPTGQQLSERWGAMIHITKLNDKKSQKVFADQFCV